MTEQKLIKTSDINLSATLLALGFGIIGIDSRNTRKVKLYFKDTTDLRQTMKEYWLKTLKVVPQPLDLFNCRREILARIHENESSQKPNQEES